MADGHQWRQRLRQWQRQLLVRRQSNDAVATGRSDGRRATGHHHAGGGLGYSITPASASVTAAAGSGTINVTAGGTCAWSATSPVQWITFTAPASGSGNGSVGYNVAANTNSSSRSATITVAGQPFVVTQAGAACDATLNPASQNFTVAGGNGGTAVSVPAGCTWSAVPSAAWITVLTGATGSGNGNVTYSVSANPNGTTRNGTIAIGGKLLNVTQDAATCTSTVSSTSESFEIGRHAERVGHDPGGLLLDRCQQFATWIPVTTGAGPNTSGNGAVTFQVAANATTTARTGSLTIAGKTVNVNQAGTCDVTLAPTGSRPALPHRLDWSASRPVRRAPGPRRRQPRG